MWAIRPNSPHFRGSASDPMPRLTPRNRRAILPSPSLSRCSNQYSARRCTLATTLVAYTRLQWGRVLRRVEAKKNAYEQNAAHERALALAFYRWGCSLNPAPAAVQGPPGPQGQSRATGQTGQTGQSGQTGDSGQSRQYRPAGPSRSRRTMPCRRAPLYPSRRGQSQLRQGLISRLKLSVSRRKI
jgi:hypothetical protein